jgi:GNAT superfamily N-acetyltransferase
VTAVAPEGPLAAADAAAAFGELADVYLEAFPPAERAPVEEVQAELAAGERLLWRAGTVGLAVVADLGTGSWVLEYLATRAGHRGGGTGRRLVAAVRDAAAAAGARCLLLEVEPPGTSPLAARRLAWYERQGAAHLDVAYAIPDAGTGDPLPMLLLALPLGGASPPTGEALRTDVQTLLLTLYGRPADDPLVRRVLDSLPAC